MKKIILPLLFLAVTSSFAQFGGRTGLEIQTLKVEGGDTYTNPAAFAGLFYNWQLSERFSLRPEFQYIYSTGNYDLDVNNSSNLTELLLSSQVEGGTMLSYRFKEKWFVSGGVVATLFVSQTDPNSQNATVGAKVGIGYTISEKSAFQFNAVLDVQGDDEFTTGEISKNAFKISYIYLF